MKRLPALAFCAMVAATVFAFFETQTLKTANPLVHGEPQPVPAAFNPVSGRLCPGTRLDYRHTTLSLRPYQAGTVGVYVLDDAGDVVADISQGRYLSANQASVFVWKGFENGGRIAPEGRYHFEALLVQQDRRIDLSQSPITVIEHDPQAPVTSVSLTGAGTAITTDAGSAKSAGPPVLTPPAGSVTINFKGGAYRRVWINVYRTDLQRGPKLVYRFTVNPTRASTTWDGNVAGGVPAPPERTCSA